MTFEELLESPPPQLTSVEASEVAADLFGITARAIALDGERDANFRLVTDDGDFSLKIANPGERGSVVEMQQLALEHIAAVDPRLPVPRPVRTREGSLVGSVDVEGREAPVRLLTFLDGRAIPDGFSTPVLRAELGSLLARLDKALRGFDHPEQDRDYLWDVTQIAGLRRHAHHHPNQRFEFVTQWLDRFREEVEPRLAALPAQVIHSDFNPENILLASDDSEAIVGVIDFADVIHSPRIIDPAVAAAYQCFGADDPAMVVAELIGAYHEVTALSGAEIGLVPDLVMARLVQSLTIGAWRADLHPDNREYILIHAEPAWEALIALSRIGTDVLRDAVRNACEPDR